MADALVSVVLEQLSSIIAQKVQQEVGLVADVKKEVRKLESNFQAIQDVLADAEQRQLKEGSIKRWMDQLKNVSYDMDDVLDEWSTAIAKSQMKVNDEHPRKTIKKVCSFMIFSCFRLREVGLRFHVARKIQTLNGRIDGIVSEKNKFNFTLSAGGPNLPEHKNYRETTSVIDATEIKGRETDKDTIVKMLLSESSDQEPALRTISLVGMGGIGKTTLAQLVYNDHEAETYFEERIWVCVSDPFDEIRIAKAILEGLNESAQNLITLQVLLGKIQESISGKRFLLVLDDVWNEDSTKWEQLKNSLKRGCLPGSRLLVTTRKREVASIMGSSSTDILELGLLSPDECWSLFSQFAFFEKNSRERENLEETGRKIAERCRGLPLAARTLGSLLRFKRSRAEWESVLNNHVWEIKEAENKLLAPLWLSYHDLPTEMRPCFLYCAVFPKDYIFRRDILIELWMAQGFLRETQNPEMEATGGECFEALVARSFFQDFKKYEYDDNIIECKMHDIVHDFAQSMTKNESFSVEIDGGPAESKMESFSRDARHSMVVFGKYGTDSFPATIHSFKKLRSLIVDGRPLPMNAALPDLIANLSCLRTLKLRRCGIEEVPSNIGKLIHLRHVDLSWNKIKELPEEMCELYNMQTLDVLGCNEVLKLPDNIGKLIKLRHLSVGHLSDWSFVEMRGFEGLGCLWELDVFHVSGSGEGSNIGGLKNLNHLQGSLEIKWLGDVKDPDEVKKAELKSKKNLTRLELVFGSRTDRGMIRDDEILEALEPPPNIDFLKISDYQGIIQVLPSWINKLRVVRLVLWGKIENLPALGKLPFLEELDVDQMKSVRKVGREFLGTEAVAAADDSDISIGEMTASPLTTVIAFPKLKSLCLWSLEEWEEWEGEGRRNEDKTIMPSLRSLAIGYCPKLKALPDYIYQSTTLEKLKIIGSPIVEMRGFEGLGCLRELDEFHVSGSGEGSNIGGLKNLNHLQGSLTITWLGDVKDPDEVKKAELKRKENLTRLELGFRSREERSIIRDDEILEALEPPPNIDWLGIGDYQGILQVLPSWFDKLKVVRLRHWGKIENLPPLGKLPFLEDLSVSSMESVRKVGREFLGMEADDDDDNIGIGEMTPSNTIIAFPRLKSLWFFELENWEEWEGEGRRNEDKTIMPSLRSLDIRACPKLKALPDYIYQSTTLKELRIIRSPILEEQFKEGGKGWPNTSHTPHIII